MTLLVTGGAGFIGSNFVLDWFSSAQSTVEPVVTLDALTYAGNPENLAALRGDARHTLVQGDICDRALVDQLLAQHRPRAIVHFAAESHVDRRIHGPGALIHTNVESTSPCWRPRVRTGAAWKLPIRRRSASAKSPPTRSVAPGSRGSDLYRTYPYEPNSHYSASKAARDHLVRAWHHTYGLPVLTINCFKKWPPVTFLRPPGLEPQGYFVLTLYRPSNVDDKGRLSALLRAIDGVSRGLPVVFPVHPRTARSLASFGGLPPGLHLVDPQPYLELKWLVKHARAAVTDSGGVTEETTVMGVPCMTLRDTTERPETVTLGTNMLLGTDPAALGPAFERLFAGRWQAGGVPPLWDGKSGERIVAALERLLPINGVSG
jgi:hypothetical protein